MDTNKISQNIKILINQFNAGNYENVISKGIVLIKKNPEYVILYNLVGSSFQKRGQFVEAAKNFKLGLKLDSKNLSLMNNLAMSYKNLLEFGLAEELYLKIIEANNKYINAYVNLGNLKRDLNKFDDAIKLYKQALDIDNNNPIIFYSLALAYQGIGDFDQTITYAQRALNINSNFTRADQLISQSINFKDHKEKYETLKKKIKDVTIQNFEKVDIYFCLAKAEEDLGNIKESSQYLIAGNKLKKELVKYNITEEINLLKDIKNNFKELSLKNIKSENDNIIFILGMPRSGTSLVEQIITSHSQVFGGGELPILSNIVKNNFITDNNFSPLKFKKIVNDELEINNLRLEFLKFLKYFKFDEKYITDKSPLNFRWIGFIKLIFPSAKIINCIRDPKNNCLSMYKNLFEGGLNFTYDQQDLVKYYKYYLDLMNFWESKFSNTIYNVKYENLISNSDHEIKKIINYCNLNWEKNCLSFHKNKTPIKTMSTAQARKPIYKTSINPFDKFKNYLKVLDNEL